MRTALKTSASYHPYLSPMWQDDDHTAVIHGMVHLSKWRQLMSYLLSVRRKEALYKIIVTISCKSLDQLQHLILTYLSWSWWLCTHTYFTFQVLLNSNAKIEGFESSLQSVAVNVRPLTLLQLWGRVEIHIVDDQTGSTRTGLHPIGLYVYDKKQHTFTEVNLKQIRVIGQSNVD